MGPPVARSAANPWAPGLDNLREAIPAGVEPTTARVCPNLFPAKALASAAQLARPSRRPTRRRARVGGGLVLGLRKSQGD